MTDRAIFSCVKCTFRPEYVCESERATENAYLQVGISKRPAPLADAAANAIVDEKVVVTDERHHKLPLVFVWHGWRFEYSIKHARAGNVVRHLDELVYTYGLQAF